MHQVGPDGHMSVIFVASELSNDRIDQFNDRFWAMSIAKS